MNLHFGQDVKAPTFIAPHFRQIAAVIGKFYWIYKKWLVALAERKAEELKTIE